MKKLTRNKIKAEDLTKQVRNRIKTTIWEKQNIEEGFKETFKPLKIVLIKVFMNSIRWPTTAIHKYLLYYCILCLSTQTYSLALRVYLPVQ